MIPKRTRREIGLIRAAIIEAELNRKPIKPLCLKRKPCKKNAAQTARITP